MMSPPTASFGILFGLSPSLKKALIFDRDGALRLVVVMTALLGWLIALALGTLALLNQLYVDWRLAQASQISIYLSAESPANDVTDLVSDILALPGVNAVQQLPTDTVRELLAPYFTDVNFPLPMVLDVAVTPHVNATQLQNLVLAAFPMAELADAREALQNIAYGVGVVQLGALALLGVVIILLALMMTLVVQTGVRSQLERIYTLQILGGADRLLQHLITHQIGIRAFRGWGVASALALASLLVAHLLAPTWNILAAPSVWASALLAPGVLTLVTLVTVFFQARRMLQQGLTP